jgi:membrane fusion protein, multidrug efflux system
VRTGSQGTYVYVVKPDSTVAMTAVTLGPAETEKTAVTKGLNEGDVVVTDGSDKLKDGDKVLLPGAKPDDGAADKKDGDAAQKPAGDGDEEKKDGDNKAQHRHHRQQQ